MATKKFTIVFAGIFILTFLLIGFISLGKTQIVQKWKLHDKSRPRPAVIDPGTASTQETAGKPPSDAIVLFNGKDLLQWRSGQAQAAKWKVKNGVMECVKGKGPIYTKQKFGDCQLHVEWASPFPPKGKGQGRGNSGVYLMSKYEIQVLDSYKNDTYPDGQAAAIYGQYPPLVNASRPPGEWQIYDIIFHRPRFNHRGNLIEPARITLLHNGVLVQDNVELLGPTMNEILLPYQYHADKLPLLLQDHRNPVRYRNIWIRELPESDQTVSISDTEKVPANILDQYVGKYEVNPDWVIAVKRDGEHLQIQNATPSTLTVYAQSERAFFSKMSCTSLDFNKNSEGKVVSLRLFHESGNVYKAIKVE